VVGAAYQRFLHRTPSADEAAGWVSAMQAGLSDAQLEAGFLRSQEYLDAHGGPGAGWVSAMYQDLLGRTPDQAEVDGWVAALGQGASPQDVAYGFAASAEREGQRVTANYVTLLGRRPSSAEVSGWVELFTHGLASNEDVIAGFVGSAEYWRRHSGNARDWLTSAYLDVLGRQPEPAAYAGWLPLLT
jgi:hypothetical protein